MPAPALRVAGADDFAVTKAVAVFKCAVDDIGDDFHIGVAVRREAAARRDAVFIDDAERTEAHERRVVVVGEAEVVEAVEPAVIGGRGPVTDDS